MLLRLLFLHFLISDAALPQRCKHPATLLQHVCRAGKCIGTAGVLALVALVAASIDRNRVLAPTCTRAGPEGNPGGRMVGNSHLPYNPAAHESILLFSSLIARRVRLQSETEVIITNFSLDQFVICRG